MSQVTVFSGVERRRVWTDEQKLALIAAASAPGSSVAQVAREADLRPSQIYRWRRDLERDVASGVAEPGFAPLLIQAAGDDTRRIEGGIIVEIGGAVVRIAANVSPTLASAVVRSLRR